MHVNGVILMTQVLRQPGVVVYMQPGNGFWTPDASISLTCTRQSCRGHTAGDVKTSLGDFPVCVRRTICHRILDARASRLPLLFLLLSSFLPMELRTSINSRQALLSCARSSLYSSRFLNIINLSLILLRVFYFCLVRSRDRRGRLKIFCGPLQDFF